MRIETIELLWFRGAADSVALEAKGKSVVVYGENGSGKSSFVDAIEYLLNNGKVGHLSHEYSGKHQQKAIINTHTARGKKTGLRVAFKDGSELVVDIKRNGTFTTSGAEGAEMSSWDYRRTVLRQDEVAAFIAFTKGAKYSALLPLLGLSQLEVMAENLRHLAKAIEQQLALSALKARLEELRAKRTKTFGLLNEAEIADKIEGLHSIYCPDKAATKDSKERCDEILAAIRASLADFSADQRRYLTLQDVGRLDLASEVTAVRSANDKLAGITEPLIKEKLEVLQSAVAFEGKLAAGERVDCPACGRPITAEEFRRHVNDEASRLREIIGSHNARRIAMAALSDSLRSLKFALAKPDVKPWLDLLAGGEDFAKSLQYLSDLNAEAIRANCGEDDLRTIEALLLPLIEEAATASDQTPHDVERLSVDIEMAEVGKAIVDGVDLAATVERSEALISFVTSLERALREEIRLRSGSVIEEISADIQKMWLTLHPSEAIEDVALYVPEDADKAIDIKLKFHGLQQDSPRLTLSEGYRNSLGLCIFLAMAKREESKERPLFLDDVVVSLDRNHRGMIADLLQKEFSSRQVFIFTHDREWYSELRHQLDEGSWIFKALMPYEQPQIGIRWSARTWSFDDARVHLKEDPDSAGNTARKIMDTELAGIAEGLKLRLPYRRLDKNDHRSAHEFLERLVSDGEKCFQIKRESAYEPHLAAVAAWREADKLLLSWGNRSSHSFDLTAQEAEKLTLACENALGFFWCPDCKSSVQKLNSEGAKLVQCQCGNLRWRYGKA